MINGNAYGWWIDESGQIYETMDKFGHKQLIRDIFKCEITEDNILHQALDKNWIRIVNDNQSFMVSCLIINDKQINALYNI